MVYFIKAGKHLKIGWANNPFKRAKELQTGNAEKCKVLLAIHTPDDKGIESLLHSNLADFHIKGEWFNVSFATALDALFEIRERLSIDGRELPFRLPPKPTLEECREEFEAWIRERCWKDREWNQEFNPVEFYWDNYQDEFLARRNEPYDPSFDPAEKFRQIRQNLSSFPESPQSIG